MTDSVGPPPARWLASGAYLPAAARLTTSGIDAAVVAFSVIDWMTPASPSPVTFSVGVTRAGRSFHEVISER
ncbi:MAG: hypothetical protein ACXWZT_10450 [Gaiellaceae bacterium]